MKIFLSTRNYFFSHLENSTYSQSVINEAAPIKRGRGRPPKIKSLTTIALANIHLVIGEKMTAPHSIPLFQAEENLLEPTNELNNNLETTNSVATEEPILENEAHFADHPENNTHSFEEENEEDWHNSSQEAYLEEEQNEDEEFYEEPVNTKDFSQNNVSLTFSWSLMNQLKYMARSEGILVEDLLIELVAEGVTKRAFEDQRRPVPSHLMTRNGYVHNDDQSAMQQSFHHNNNLRTQNQTQQNRTPGKFNNNFQARNNYQPQNRNNPNQYNNRNNYSQSQNKPQQNQGNSIGYRSQNQFNTQPRYNRYNNTNNLTNNNINTSNNNQQPQQQQQRFYDDQAQPQARYNKDTKR